MPTGINDMIMSNANTSEALSSLEKLTNNNDDFIMNTMQESETDEAIQNQEVLNTALNNKRDLSKLLRYMKPKTMIREHKVGRNDPCPCGSGKKYKNCCLSSGKYENLSVKK